MFHFGLFSTFAPYLVIAAIYFCGLASYSVDIVNRHINGNQDNTSNIGEYEFLSNVDYHIIVVNKNHASKSINIQDKEYIYTTYIKTIWNGISKPDFKENNYSFSIFSRPPPYLS